MKAPGVWTPPKPRELPTWRRDLVAARRTPEAAQAHAVAIANELGTVHDASADPLARAVELNLQEADRLEGAELYYATRDATRLSVSVADELACDELRPGDAPSRAGLILFEEPIVRYARDPAMIVDHVAGRVRNEPARTVEIVALSWGPHRAASYQIPVRRDGVWFTLYARGDVIVEQYIAETFPPGSDSRAIAYARTAFHRNNGPLAWDNEYFLPFDTDLAPVREMDIFRWVLAVRAAWMLMQSPGITESTEVRQSKTDIKRERNEHGAVGGRMSPPAAVRVVDLRRSQTHGVAQRGEHEGQHGRRIYTCRWMVRGHTRTQRYGPNNTLTKRIYIEAHLQGPDGAPLKAARTETVKLFDV